MDSQEKYSTELPNMDSSDTSTESEILEGQEADPNEKKAGAQLKPETKPGVAEGSPIIMDRSRLKEYIDDVPPELEEGRCMDLSERLKEYIADTPGTDHLDRLKAYVETTPGGGEDTAIERDRIELDPSTLLRQVEALPSVPDPGLRHGRRVASRPSLPGAYNIGTRNQQQSLNDLETDGYEGGHNGTIGDLPQANPVEENDLENARLVDLQAVAAQQKAKNDQRNGYSCFVGWVILAVTLSIGLAAAFAKDDSAGLPTTAPTESPSLSRTSAPTSVTGSLDLLLERLPETTLDNIDRSTTAQWQAFSWLENHPELQTMQEWRKDQLLALATFFFAMGGPSWREEIRERWLRYDMSECLWFTNAWGLFDPASDVWEEGVGYEVENDWLSEHDIEPCNLEGKFQALVLNEMDLSEAEGLHLPPEVSLLTSLTHMILYGNTVAAPISSFLPSEFYQMTNLVLLDIGFPSQLGMMTSLSHLELKFTQLNGHLPTQLGLLTRLDYADLSDNELCGTLPTEMALLTRLSLIRLERQKISGTIPSQWGQLVSMVEMDLFTNHLTGMIPSELALMTNIEMFEVDDNSMSGPIPSEILSMSSLKQLWLNNNTFSGTIPQVPQGFNGSLEALTLNDNLFTGVIQEELCLMGLFYDPMDIGLGFDCSDQLCGCCWCPCSGSIMNSSETDCPLASKHKFDPALGGDKWPGEFPTPVNSSNIIVINVYTDDYPEETTLEWSMEVEAGVWQVLDLYNPELERSLFSYKQEVMSHAKYRLRISDSWGDGTCCTAGFGWFSITNSTTSRDHVNGTVVWYAGGDILHVEASLMDSTHSVDVFIWVDPNGGASHVEMDNRGDDHLNLTHLNSSVSSP